MRRLALFAFVLLGALRPAQAGADVPEVQKKKVLRVLVAGSGEQFLARRGRPEAEERELAAELASRLGVRAQFVAVPDFSRLIPMLLEGAGDVAASQPTITPEREREVAFTTPLATVSERVVGKRGAADLPNQLSDLVGKKVWVRPTSSYADSLRKLIAQGISVELAPVEESADEEDIAYQVGQGALGLTVIDSHLLAAILTYNPDVEPLFDVATDRKIAWAVRKDSPLLKDAADKLIAEKKVSDPSADKSTGDLAEIQKRGVLRVLTRNNSVTYFLYRGETFGFEYELVRQLAKKLGVRLEMVVVPSRALLVPWLLEGQGDLIAASLTRTAEREKQVAFSSPYLEVEELLVQKKGSALGLKAMKDLPGKVIHVRKSSSYWNTLERLKTEVGDFNVVLEGEDMETEQIIQKVGTAQIPFTVADSHILKVELAYRDDIQASFPVSKSKGELAFAMRPDNPLLKSAVDGFVKPLRGTAVYRGAELRYFKLKRGLGAKPALATALLGKYDDLFKKYGAQYGFDWRLLVAMAHQESGLDPAFRGWAGGVGLLQVLPKTGAELGYGKLADPDQGIHAGVKLLAQYMRQFDEKIPYKHRVRFALAAYAIGSGHVFDAQRVAAEQKLKTDAWFGNVEKAMLLLERSEHAKRARYGFCRGEQAVLYVSEIETKYRALMKAAPKD